MKKKTRKTCQNCFEVFLGYSMQKFCDQCKFVDCVCEKCGDKFTRTRIQIMGRKNVGENARLFCSTKCAITYGSGMAGEQRINGSLIQCPNCGKDNYKSKADERRVFCNSKCYGEYRKKHPEKYPSQMRRPEVISKVIKTRRENGTNYFLGRKAELHPKWKGGKVKYRGPSWEESREKARKRDKGVCVACNMKGRDVHHIMPFRKFKYKGGENRNDIDANHRDNLILLCRKCHGFSESNNNINLPNERVNKAIEHYKKSTKNQAIVQDRML